MNRLQQLQDKDLWAWALTGKDVDMELETAISHYRRRFEKRPFLRYCPKGACLELVNR